MPKVFLFPGQASQFVGMGHDLMQEPVAQEMYGQAKEVLGFDIAAISFEGPDETLKKTQYTQPAIFIHSLIVDKLLKERGEQPVAVAGHSLGEFSALVSAGVLNFEDGLQVVKVRSEEMAKAGTVSPGSMAAILGASEEQLEEICNHEGVVVPANINAPGQVVISGEVGAVQNAIEKAKELGIRRALPLNVSGAFHSPLMIPAREPLSKILDNVSFNDPDIPVYQNVTAKPTRDKAEIRQNLIKQLENPVRWMETISAMKSDGYTNYLEVGPGKVLQGLHRRIDRDLSISGVGKLEEIKSYEI